MEAVHNLTSLPGAPLLLLVGSLLLLSLWLLARLRSERMPGRMLAEGAAVILGACGAALAGYALHPIVFIVVLYALLMRVRILVDAGNLFAARGAEGPAHRFYELALRLGPTEADEVLVRLNEGILALRAGKLEEALCGLSKAAENRRLLGTRQQSGCLFNLGVCYEKMGRADEAIRAYDRASDAHPAGEFGRRAQAAAERVRAARKAELAPGSGG